MENLYIKSTEFTPEVDFNFEKGYLKLSGESYSELALKFYLPILDKLETFLSQTDKKVIFDFKLSYFNTNSSKRILDIIKTLKEFEERGGDVTINWYYTEGDFDLKEEVEDYELVCGINIHMIPVPVNE